jgi:hypothetical protein
MTGRGENAFPAVNSFHRPTSYKHLERGTASAGPRQGRYISVWGFRAIALTLPNEMGRWNLDAIERKLAPHGRE